MYAPLGEVLQMNTFEISRDGEVIILDGEVLRGGRTTFLIRRSH